MSDLVDGLRAGLAQVAAMQHLLPERHPLPPDVAARFVTYNAAQHERAREANELQAKIDALADHVRIAKNEFFQFVSHTMPELRGKSVQLNPEDGTYQLYGAANEEQAQ